MRSTSRIQYVDVQKVSENLLGSKWRARRSTGRRLARRWRYGDANVKREIKD